MEKREYSYEDTESQPNIRFRLDQDLTPREFTRFASHMRGLYTICWLIREGRIEDLKDYSLTEDKRYEDEAGVVIANSTSPHTDDIDIIPAGTELNITFPASHDPSIAKIMSQAIISFYSI